MGVRGLSSFIYENEYHFLTTLHFRDNYLIIDGNNLLHDLHQQLGNDYIFGGDSSHLGRIVENFVTNLRLCKIIPIVIFDGATDSSHGLKARKKKASFEQRLQQCWKLHKYGNTRGLILPKLTGTVFRQVLDRLSVDCYHAFEEADAELAAFANHYQCPVLSHDSDFFIFELQFGFIPLSRFHWQSVATDVLSGTEKQLYIQCRLFKTETLKKFVPKLDTTLLPFLACFMGNDYIESDVLETVLLCIRKSEKVKGIHVNTEYQKKAWRVLNWISDKSKTEIIETILKQIKLDQRKKIRKSLEDIWNAYCIPDSSMLNAVLCGIASDVSIYKGSNLPVWFLESHFKGQQPSTNLKLAKYSTLSLDPQINDFDQCSSYSVSESLQELLMCLLRHPDHEKVSVTIYDRLGRSLHTRQFERSTCKVPGLESLNSWNVVDKRNLLCSALNTSPKEMTSFSLSIADILQDYNASKARLSTQLHKFCQLLIFLRFWFQKTKHPVNLCLVDGFICSLVYYFIRFLFGKQSSFFKSNISNGVDVYLKSDLVKSVDMTILHCISEFQAIASYANSLNMLLGCPLPVPDFEHYWNGILVYNFSQAFEKQSSCKSVKNHIFRANSLNKLNLFIKNWICNISTDEELTKKTNKHQDCSMQASYVEDNVESRVSSKLQCMNL